MMGDRIRAVAQAYNEARQRRGMRPDYHSTGKRPTEIFVHWCDARKIDPIRFIDLVCPELSRLPPIRFLGSEVTERIYDAASFDDNMTAVGPRSKSMDLWPVQEKLKHRYRANPKICVLRVKFTGGFTPRSEICLSCPEQERCRAIRIR